VGSKTWSRTLTSWRRDDGALQSQGLKEGDIRSGAEDGASGWWSPTLGNRGTGDTVALAHSKQARTQRVAITRSAGDGSERSLSDRA
jgi:hypothetical protein